MTIARHIWLACLCVMAFPLVPARAGTAPPPDAAAVVGHVSGSGYVDPGRRPLTGSMGLRINDQVVLRTGKVSLRLADGTMVTLAAPAQFQIEAVRDAAGRSILQVVLGRLFVRSRQRRGNEVHVVTPSATLAVRGSSGGVDANPQGTLCWCDEGLVYVDAAGERVVLRPGYQTMVPFGQPPGAPAPMGEDTRALNEDLNLDAAVNQTPEGNATGGEVPAGEGVWQAHVVAAEEVIRRLFEAYEREDLAGAMECLATSFAAHDGSGPSRDLTLVQESLRQDFLSLENLRFFRQPGTSRRFSPGNDEVSLHERWIVNAVLASGARFQQGGETVFTVGADPAGGGLRVLRWEGDAPFGRYQPTNDRMAIGAPTVITPPGAGMPDVLLTRGSVASGGAEVTGADAQVRAGGVVLQATDVTLTAAGSIALGGTRFEINGAQATAETVTVTAAGSFEARNVVLTAGGIRVEAESLDVSGGTVSFRNAVITDAAGNSASVVNGTVSLSGTTTVFSGVTASGQPVSVHEGQIVYDIPPDQPLPTGRGERLADGQGFRFATGVVSSSPGDLTLSGGRLEVDGEAKRLGVVPFADVLAAPAGGYSAAPIPLDSLASGEVIVAKLADGGYAKIAVRLVTTEGVLVFDWVHNPSGPALSRGRRRPSRATVVYDAKVYSREASGHQAFLRSGTQTVAEARVEWARELNNGAGLEAFLSPRISTDRQVESQSAVMDRFGIRYFQPGEYEVSLGDLSGEFTPYTLNQTLLGLVGWHRFAIGPAGTARFSTAIGPRWRPGAGLRGDGWVTGMRLATEEIRDLGPLLEDMVVGLNVVRATRGKRYRGDYLSSTVYSVDAALRARGGLGLMAEYAFSWSDDTRQRRKGEALLLRGAYRIGPVRLVLDRERVGTGFVSVGGTATSDQERTNLWFRFRPNQWLSANFHLLHTRDNLDGAKAFTTRLTTPRYGISISPFYPLLQGGFLRNLTLDVLLSTSMRASDDAARTVDRKYRTLSLSLIQRMGDFYLIAGRDETRDLDFTADGVSRRGWATDVSLRWRPARGLFSIPLSPMVGYRSGRDTYSGGPRGVIASRIQSRRVGVEIGNDQALAVELGYELLDNHRTDLGGYDRRVLNIDLTRALDAEGTRRAGISYRVMRNEQENGARSYTEGQLTGSLSQRF